MSIENYLLGNNSSVLVVVTLIRIISLAFIWMAQALRIVCISTREEKPLKVIHRFPLYTTCVLTVTLLKLMLSILIIFR